MLFNRRDVRFGSIPFMTFESIFRVLFGQRNHDAIACHFCEHARRGDRLRTLIPFDNPDLRRRTALDHETVDQQEIRGRRYRGGGFDHRAVVRALDTNFIDGYRVDYRNAIPMTTGEDCVEQGLAFSAGQTFGIVHTRNRRSKNHCGGHDRPGQRAAPRFIDTRHATAARGDRIALEIQARGIG